MYRGSYPEDVSVCRKAGALFIYLHKEGSKLGFK